MMDSEEAKKRVSNLQIRDARVEDLDAMREGTLAAYREYAAMMPAYAWEIYRDDMVATIGEDIAHGIVAEEDGEVVGSVLLFPAGAQLEVPLGESLPLETPEVRLLAVPPQARGKGIGKALMEECIRRARTAGSKAVTLHTADIMQTAMQMYERMGFVRFPEIDFHPEPGTVIKGYIYYLDDAGG